jgi:hypothetical protein
MRKLALALAILGTTLVPALYTSPAHAQATRTWVSGVGDDANPCSRTAPCKTFAGAISKTANGGTIDCLDPGGFGAVTITKSISIQCDEVSNGGVLVSGTNAIIVQAGPLDKVLLSGLDIDGVGTGLNGVGFNSGVELIIHDCWIHNFATNGVNVNTSTANARVVITNSRILNNGTNGTANTGGVNVNQNGGASFTLIHNSPIENNQNYALQATGASTAVAVMNSVLIPTGLVINSSAQVVSFGPSNIYGTATNPTSTPAFR